MTEKLPIEFRWLTTREHVERGNEGLRRQRALVAELEMKLRLDADGTPKVIADRLRLLDAPGGGR